MQIAQSSTDLVQEDQDLHDFQQRAEAHETRAMRTPVIKVLGGRVRQTVQSVPARINRLPRRYLLHMVVLLLVPMGLMVNGDPNATANTSSVARSSGVQNQPRPVLGLSTTTYRNDAEQAAPAPTTEAAKAPVGDPPINDQEFENLVVPVLQPVQAKPAVPVAEINVEKANLRGGPGVLFDTLDKLEAGTGVRVLARHEDWAHIQTDGGQTGWVALELLDITGNIDGVAAAQDVPELPPARIAVIVEDNLNLRDGPGTDYVSLGKLSLGTQVDLLARYDGWVQLQTPNGTVGWSTAEYMEIAPGVLDSIEIAESIPESNPALAGVINTDGVNLRGGPSTGYDSLGKMAVGTELALVASYKDWLKVTTPRGTTGWVSAELVDTSSFVLRRVPYTNNIPALPKPAPAAPAAPAPRAPQPAAGGAPSGDVASAAWQFVGYPYVWGGESPRVGFDCSGLTKYLYSLVGVHLPHSAAGQYSSRYGTFISGLDNLQAGDLLFFVNTAGPGITHVGIYVGNGTMVNAMTPASGIGAVSIYNSYWLSHYYGALRPYR